MSKAAIYISVLYDPLVEKLVLEAERVIVKL